MTDNSHFRIQGGKTLSGSIPVYGSKNAALPLLAATLLTEDSCALDNIPSIADVSRMLEIFSEAGVHVSWENMRTHVHASSVDMSSVGDERIGMLRGSILLMGAMLGRNRHVRLPRPGGDIIGARPIDVHLDAFGQLGARIEEDGDIVVVDGSAMKAGKVVLREMSVTATENVLMAAATLPGTTVIEIAAAEPHVEALARMLSSMGCNISGAGTHTITIEGAERLAGCEFTNIPDMLEAGFFILLGAATASDISVENVPIDHLALFFKKLEDIGIGYEIEGSTVHVRAPETLSAFEVMTLPYPGIPTDLQAPFSVIATQANGSSLIHDPMYEGRFKYVDELIKMGADAIVCDPHRVVINGATQLIGRTIPSLDIRAGATLIMAGLVAKGETIIRDAHIVDRGYANLAQRLQGLGADIVRE